jgi:hypothetical protein
VLASLKQSCNSAKEVPIELQNKFANVFNVENATQLSAYKRTNYSINFKDSKVLLYSPIYFLSPWKLEELCKYFEENLKYKQIRLLKNSAKALILFVSKKNSSLCLYINY